MNIEDEDLNEVISALNQIENLLSYMEKSPYTFTLYAYHNFIVKVGALNNDIQKLDSNYTSRVLLRVLIEHFTVSYYILFKHLLDKSDDVGADYYGCYLMSEFLKRTMYELGIEGMINAIDKNAQFINLKKRLGDDFNDLQQTDLEQIYQIGGQFDIKKIQSFILKNKLPGAFFHTVNKTVIPDFLYLYNILSSYIHGGPHADKEFENNTINVTQDKEYSKSLFYLTIVNFFILLTSIDTDFNYLGVYIKIPNYKNKS